MKIDPNKNRIKYHQYRIIFDDLQVEYIDKKYIDVQANFYNINKTTKALNSTLKLKTDIPDDTKVKIIFFYENGIH